MVVLEGWPLVPWMLRRVLRAGAVLMVVASIVFVAIRHAPGDAATIAAGDHVAEPRLERMRADLGLDAPVAVQFTRWCERLLRGELGDSFVTGLPVARLIGQRIEPTVSLAAATILLSVLVAVPLGALAAWRPDAGLRRALGSFSSFAFSVPVYVSGMGLIWCFALYLPWFPTHGYSRLEQGFWPWIRSLTLPALTLSIVHGALIARVTQAAVSATVREPFMVAARAKGLTPARLLFRHALAHAAPPIVTTIATSVSLLIGGVVVTESVFAIPGLGSLTVEAVTSRDLPLLQGIALLFASACVTVNLLVELSYVLLDPRVRP